MKNILVSAMVQSKQLWLSVLRQPTSYGTCITSAGYRDKFIAHCLPDDKIKLADRINHFSNAIILIGPEGDFTEEEIRLAKENNFLAVSLGNSRLRTETAGVAAAVIMKL
jgi:16S rRNA (uracil1498-N3)-methyltransferase